MSDVKAILADTLAHGFEFLAETVKKHGTTYPAQIAVVRDLRKFDATFPGVIIAQEDSSSMRVWSQGINREAQASNRGKYTPSELQTLVVKGLLGVETATVVIRAYIDGEWLEFASQEEADMYLAELHTSK